MSCTYSPTRATGFLLSFERDLLNFLAFYEMQMSQHVQPTYSTASRRDSTCVDIVDSYFHQTHRVAPAIGILRVMIGPEGGQGHSNELALFAPEGALSSDTALTLRSYIDDPTLSASDDQFSYVLSLEPHGLKFDQPVQLKFPFTAARKSWLLKLV